MFSRILSQTYRCPDELASFELCPNLSSVPGYFRFGKESICYGRSEGDANRSYSGNLIDMLGKVSVENNKPVLPFDPDEIIENLLLERYITRSQSLISKAVHGTYYLVRPLLPVWFRRHIQRFRLNSSRRATFPQWPLDWTADQVLETLLAVALKARGGTTTPFISFWPNGVRSCAIITHDVETATGLAYCSNLMNTNDLFGIKSSFQLVPEERYEVTDEVLKHIRDRGFEINVHDLNHDGHLYSSQKEFSRRVSRINAYAESFGAKGFRSGAMYRNPEWYDAFNFDYDMSLPNAGHLEAQSGGCCTLRPFFIQKLIELPLTTTQDYSLFHILGQYSTDLWKKQIDRIVERRGLISFIVHPDYVIEESAHAIYKSILAYLAELRDDGKIEIALPGDVAQWWRQRNDMKLECRNGGWKVTGVGSERARVSFACLNEDNAIVYSD